MDNNVSKKVQAHYKVKDKEFDQFFDSLTFEYKLLKKLTHECQMNCFAVSNSSRKQAESCARKCLDPYLHVRKLVGDKLQVCDLQYQQSESKCMNNEDLDLCYAQLNLKIKQCLQSQQQYSKDLYKSVFKEFEQR